MSDNRNVFLIGPMGAGKSTIGKYLSEFLHLEFVDSDTEIEKRPVLIFPGFLMFKGKPVSEKGRKR